MHLGVLGLASLLGGPMLPSTRTPMSRVIDAAQGSTHRLTRAQFYAMSDTERAWWAQNHPADAARLLRAITRSERRSKR